MLSFFNSFSSDQAQSPQEQLQSLAKKLSKENKESCAKQLNKVIELVQKGAKLNKKVESGETLTYLLCKKADIHFVLKILELGGDPRIANKNGKSLFSPAPYGRDIFMRVCWLEFTGEGYAQICRYPISKSEKMKDLIYQYKASLKSEDLEQKASPTP